jgi:hypothetical protein
MAEEWRVSLIFDRGAGVRVGSRRKHVRDLPGSRLGHELRVSADENRVFVYGAAPWAAEEANQVARDVLAEQNLSAQVQVDYWDPAIGDWRNPDATPQDSPASGKRRADRTGLLRSVIDAVAEFLPF